MAHPFSGSWGYQVTSYFAPTPRFGTPDEFRAFVDRLHEARRRRDPRLGARRTSRATSGRSRASTARALFEHADPRRGAHPDWGTLIFNFGRLEVRNFLLASALYWLREYHTDGIRVDAVASMLYLDYSRKEGQWVPNEFGGREDLEAVVVPQGAQHGRLRPRAGDRLRRRGVDRVAGRLAADLRRRPGLRLQVEHGLDARHAGLLPAGPDPPPLPPPRADLLARLRLQRELHPAPQPRRGRPRQGLAVHQDAGRPLAEARQPARPVRLHVGAPRQEAAVHGLRAGPGVASGATSARWTGTCSRTPSTPASSRWCATSTASTASARRCGRSTTPTAASTGWSPTTPPTTSSPSAARARTRCATSWPSCATSRRCRARATASACRRPAAGSRRSTPTSRVYGGSNTGNLGGVEAEETGWGGQPFSAELTLPPLSVLWLVPER